MIPAVKEKTTSLGSVDRIRPEAVEPSENVRIDGSKTEVLSQGGTESREGSEPGVERDAKKGHLKRRHRRIIIGARCNSLYGYGMEHNEIDSRSVAQHCASIPVCQRVHFYAAHLFSCAPSQLHTCTHTLRGFHAGIQSLRLHYRISVMIVLLRFIRDKFPTFTVPSLISSSRVPRAWLCNKQCIFTTEFRGDRSRPTSNHGHSPRRLALYMPIENRLGT